MLVKRAKVTYNDTVMKRCTGSLEELVIRAKVKAVPRAVRDKIFAYLDGTETGVILAVSYARRVTSDQTIDEYTRFTFLPEISCSAVPHS